MSNHQCKRLCEEVGLKVHQRSLSVSRKKRSRSRSNSTNNNLQNSSAANLAASSSFGMSNSFFPGFEIDTSSHQQQQQQSQQLLPQQQQHSGGPQPPPGIFPFPMAGPPPNNGFMNINGPGKLNGLPPPQQQNNTGGFMNLNMGGANIDYDLLLRQQLEKMSLNNNGNNSHNNNNGQNTANGDNGVNVNVNGAANGPDSQQLYY
ncbi:unnamed protein product [Ambrosiozyma monospora]|uniref:Unnamed protein product n=1 Tax=Ambrosiozyma monospora TaxID=43982 RepID=A0ACB5TY45_AMBMO|nr:unnamed protein product [Ambrosiozyma monospora]